MPLSQLTTQQRAAVLEKTRAGRRQLTARFQRGDIDRRQVLEDAETDDFSGPMKVSTLLEALPKAGKVKARKIMTELEIHPARRLRGLGFVSARPYWTSLAPQIAAHRRGPARQPVA
ncbi:hypothetical protein A5706_09760 [Mycobacterium sp. E796]|nr:hypothetical protein A5706_09760 [Mycobacterium sp. E796]